jgi:thymidylate synthase (FAD)
MSEIRLATNVAFKTIHECRVELVAYTKEYRSDYENDGTYDADWLPVRAARASFQNEDKTGSNEKADRRLLNSLARDQHFGVFEHQSATVLIECPLFVRSQIHRHRTAAFNEWSRRYTSERIGFWVPDKWRKQSDSNKQASTDESVEWIDTDCWEGDPHEDYREIITGDCSRYAGVLEFYNAMIEAGICREQARAVLPQSLLTQFYMTANLRNWAHFLRLRLDSHTQFETRVIAQRIETHLRNLWPDAMNALIPTEES